MITGFVPSEGPIGTKITIDGSNLSDATSVKIGGVAATFTLFDGIQIVATVPSGAGAGQIVVETPGGTATSTGFFFVTTALPPTITSFSPVSGPVGTEVTLEGDDLAGATEVRFNGAGVVPRAGFSGTDLVAKVPAGATTGPLTVVTPGGTYTTTAAFTVLATPAPRISGFSPGNGPTDSLVLINGQNLEEATSVSFNGAIATFTLLGTSLTAKVPAGATSGPITVVTPGGTATSAVSFIISLPGAPAIISFTPERGKPDASVTINGANLEGVSAVQFNGTSASFTLFGQSLFATVPAGALSGPITVVTAKGNAVSGSPFTVLDPLAPEITGFTPVAGPEGTTVTISGTNFVGVTEVSFGGVTTSDLVVLSSSRIAVPVPPGAFSGPLEVTTPKGTGVSTESFIVPPVVLSFTPIFGEPGTPVTVRGANFTGAVAVVFGSGSATFTIVSDSEIRTTVPSDATSGAISVATQAGFGSSHASFYLPPRITAFDPSSGLEGMDVTITGENFVGVTDVEFGALNAEFTAVSSTVLNAKVPTFAVNGPITVTTPGGSATSTNSFGIGLFCDLAVSISAMPDVVNPNDLLKYSIVVTNNSQFEATNVVVTSRLPEGVELFVLPPGIDCTQNGNTITCNLGTVVHGMDVTLRLFTTVIYGPYLTNLVTAVSSNPDSDPSNNTASLLTVLQGAPPPVPDNVRLSAAASGNTFVISWTAPADAFTLETSPNLGPSAVWTAVTDLPSVSNGSYRVTQNVSSGTRFYRLHAK